MSKPRHVRPRKRSSARTRVAVITASVVVAGLGGVAYASIPSATGVITGCRTNNGGALRVIDVQAKQVCTKTETKLTWNSKGVPGPAGPAGPAGPTGATGPQGPAGDSFITMQTHSAQTTQATYNADEDAWFTFLNPACPAGSSYQTFSSEGGGSVAQPVVYTTPAHVDPTWLARHNEQVDSSTIGYGLGGNYLEVHLSPSGDHTLTPPVLYTANFYCLKGLPTS